jgi:AcrR family transcriptional regulator
VTNSVEDQTSAGKRERLVASAAKLLYEQGAQGATLAEIAAAADVPPGNVYYYFKTRDDLVRAVIEARGDEVRRLVDSLERRSTPAARLKGLAKEWLDAADMVADHGCPIGSFCAEVTKLDGDIGRECSLPLDLLLSWAEAQFRAMGRRDARTLATTLIARVQGAALLTNVLHDPKLMRGQVRDIERWVDALRGEPGS